MSALKIHGIEVANNIEVKFKTHSRIDAQTYYGTVLGTVNFQVALGYADVISEHENMSVDVAKLEPSALTYVLVKTTDGALRPFAVDWIDAETFERTDTASDATIVIYSISNEKLAQIMTYIREAGFDCKKK